MFSEGLFYTRRNSKSIWAKFYAIGQHIMEKLLFRQIYKDHLVTLIAVMEPR